MHNEDAVDTPRNNTNSALASEFFNYHYKNPRGVTGTSKSGSALAYCCLCIFKQQKSTKKMGERERTNVDASLRAPKGGTFSQLA